jgi:hypothetical protein
MRARPTAENRASLRRGTWRRRCAPRVIPRTSPTTSPAASRPGPRALSPEWRRNTGRLGKAQNSGPLALTWSRAFVWWSKVAASSGTAPWWSRTRQESSEYRMAPAICPPPLSPGARIAPGRGSRPGDGASKRQAGSAWRESGLVARKGRAPPGKARFTSRRTSALPAHLAAAVGHNARTPAARRTDATAPSASPRTDRNPRA